MASNYYSTTIIKLTLDQTVAITESFYSSLSWTKLFAELGGSLGLWLGVGMLQMTATFYEAFSGMLFKKK